MSYRPDGHLYGVHRVVEPVGSLPQAAERLDNSAPAFDNEVTIAVRTLNVDSASFHQIVGEVGRDEAAIGRHIEAIVDERGKMQNPVTGSGGMLIGDVVDVGPRYEGPVELSRGDQVATLVSLTLTPLRIASIEAVRAEADQVEVRGEAYLWPSAPLVVLPDDLPNRLALSVLDVCGAPAQTRRLVEGAERVLVLGMGKSGMLCAAAARDTLGEEALICGFDLTADALETMNAAGIVDAYRTGDATRPVEVLEAVREMSDGALFDVVINTCNVADTEMAAILPCRDRGKVYLFNMATSFAQAALGAEGVGKDVNLLVGNGYARGHAAYALELVRTFEVVRNEFG